MNEELASNGTPMDVLTEEDWSEPYGLGKFDTVAEEKIWSWTLDSGQDDDCGNSSDWHWWAARFDGNRENPVLRAGVIIEERSGGAVCAIRYSTSEELDKAWASRELRYAEYVHSKCENGIDCWGCEHCEN